MQFSKQFFPLYSRRALSIITLTCRSPIPSKKGKCYLHRISNVPCHPQQSYIISTILCNFSPLLPTLTRRQIIKQQEPPSITHSAKSGNLRSQVKNLEIYRIHAFHILLQNITMLTGDPLPYLVENYGFLSHSLARISLNKIP